MTQHPPGYFAIMAVAARVFDVIDKTPHTALLILRLCSALLLAPLPFLTFRIGKLLGATPAVAAAASFLPAGLPQLTHIGGAVNNDSLTIMLGAAVTWLALEFVTRRAVRGWAIGLGVTMTALLWTKGTALPMLVVVAAAFLLRAKRFGVRRTLATLFWHVVHPAGARMVGSKRRPLRFFATGRLPEVVLRPVAAWPHHGCALAARILSRSHAVVLC